MGKRKDLWVAACGGTELPFRTRSGRVLHYMWNVSTCEHKYYDVAQDRFLEDLEAFAYIDPDVYGKVG